MLSPCALMCVSVTGSVKSSWTYGPDSVTDSCVHHSLVERSTLFGTGEVKAADDALTDSRGKRLRSVERLAGFSEQPRNQVDRFVICLMQMYYVFYHMYLCGISRRCILLVIIMYTHSKADTQHEATGTLGKCIYLKYMYIPKRRVVVMLAQRVGLLWSTVHPYASKRRHALSPLHAPGTMTILNNDRSTGWGRVAD